jgi:hypothetical protein
MRVCAVLLFLLLGSTTAAIAQEAAVGVKAGVNFSNLNIEGEGVDFSFDQRTGFVGGLFVVVPANSLIALQLEGLYSQKGAKLEEGGGSATIKVDYFDVPVLLRVSSDPAAQASFHVFGGPSFGFKLRARAKSSFDGETESEDIGEDVETFDFGVVAGAGVELGRFIVDGRYCWGLSPANKDDEEGKIKNRVFSIMAGIRF